MKRKILLAGLFVLLVLLRSNAASVSVANAKQVALNFYKITFPNQAGHGATAVLKYTQTEADSSVDFYVFDIVPLNGFVIVSADNAVMPVIAYSNESYFNVSFQQTGVADWINKSAAQIHNTVLQQIPADSRINNLWQAYLAGNNPGSAKSNAVGPLLSTTWNQLPYYNELCPVSPNDGQLSVTGCVATAMAQIMKYWNYPPQGTGSFSYYDGGNEYQLNIGTLSANFGATTYQWTQMPNELTGNNTAVATLMSQCGISVAMDYSDEESGAVVLQSEADAYFGYADAPCAQYSYPNYFLYNPNTIEAVYQDNYSTSQWTTLIEAEMNAGRVVQYQGEEPNVGGHTWVCDGYDVNDNLHMNWGWGGVDDGFFTVTNLSAGGYTFYYDDAALIGIEPLNYNPHNNDTICSLTASFTYQNAGGSLIQFSNTSTSDFNQTFSSSWTFYNSQGQFAASAVANPQITYTGQPPYSAKLIIDNSSIAGCRDTVSQSVSFNPNTTCITFQEGATRGTGAALLSDFANDNYDFAGNSGYTEFYANQWTVGGVPTEGRGLLRYDLSQIPVGSVIVSAELSLYTDTNDFNSYQDQPTYGANNASYLHQVTSPWDSATVTWNTQPAVSNSAEVLLPQSANTNEDYLNLDISSFVQDWVNKPDSNYGMLLRMITQSYYNAMVFCSPAYPDTARWPKLEICYVAPNPCHARASFVQQNTGNGTVQFTNTSTDSIAFTSYWIFYDSSGQFATSNLTNPLITFTGQPPYSVTLIITDSICTDTASQLADLNNCVTLQGGNTKGIGAGLGTDAPNDNYDFATGYSQFVANQWTNEGVPVQARSLLKYDLSEIPLGSAIVSAKLSLYTDTGNVSTSYHGEPTYGTNNACYLQQVTSTWDAATVTFNTQPPVTTNNEVLLPQSTNTDEDYFNIDISGFVQYWVNNPANNYGILLSMIAQSYYNAMVFCSTGYPDSTQWPKLEICYQLAAPCHLAASFTQQNLGNNRVQFINTSTINANTLINWTFYNGAGIFTTSTQVNPLITFSGYSPYRATVQITDTGTGCIDTLQQPAAPVATGIENINANGDENISVYPNPLYGSLPAGQAGWQLAVGNNLIGAQIEILDDNGRLVYKSEIKSAHSEIEMSLTAGVYLLRVITDAGVVAKKLVKL